MPILKLSYGTKFSVSLVIGVLSGSLLLAQDTSRGFKYNNLTVSPYVNLEYRYDSNVNLDQGGRSSSNQKEESDTILMVNPGVDLTYTGNEWGLAANAWYSYDFYTEMDRLNADRYGEKLNFYRESAKGWRFIVQQSYIKSSQNDSIIDGGNGLWRDREQFDLSSAVSYQLSEKTGLTLSGMYMDLAYNNDANKYDPLYGWTEYSLGLEMARKLTEKSNLLVSGSYQEYISARANGVGPQGSSANSTGYTLQAGLGSRATERITYRVLTGMSMFDYAGGEQLTGWTYSLDANWVINKKLVASVAGSSYYQPSESEANQAMQVYALSTGLSYHPMRKLTTRLDVAFRREEEQITNGKIAPTTDDLYSIRARADYQLQRYVTLYGGLEYEDRLSDNPINEYDRYRGSIGLSFRY